jgi:hypothetical protein
MRKCETVIEIYTFTEIYEVGGGSAVNIVNTVLYWIAEDLETDSQHRQNNFMWAKLQDKLWALTSSPTQWDKRVFLRGSRSKVLKESNKFHLVYPFPYTPLPIPWLHILPFQTQRFLYVQPGLTFNNSTRCSPCFECLVRISEQTATFAVYVIKWLIFMTVVESVYSAVRTDFLYKAGCYNLSESAYSAVRTDSWYKRVFITVVESVYTAVWTDYLYNAGLYNCGGKCLQRGTDWSLIQYKAGFYNRGESFYSAVWTDSLYKAGFYNRGGKCSQRGTEWFIIWRRLRIVFKRLNKFKNVK